MHYDLVLDSFAFQSFINENSVFKNGAMNGNRKWIIVYIYKLMINLKWNFGKPVSRSQSYK